MPKPPRNEWEVSLFGLRFFSEDSVFIVSMLPFTPEGFEVSDVKCI